jgi:hypothetical protein
MTRGTADDARNQRRERLQPRNLEDAFDLVGNQQVFKTPSANIAVAIASLDRLPEGPEVDAIRNYLKATAVQINEWQLSPTALIVSSQSHRNSQRQPSTQPAGS